MELGDARLAGHHRSIIPVCMPPDHPSTDGLELRETLLTYVPAILVAFALNWMFRAQLGMESRRAMLASIGIGIVIAIVLQRVLHSRVDGAGRDSGR